MYTFKTGSMVVPAKVWAARETVEPGCLEQVEHMASLPFAFHHVVLNSDGHQGYGIPVGGVLAAKGYVIPNAVGVDVGCGVRAVRTSVTTAQLAEAHAGEGTNLQAVIGKIMRDVPVGFPPAGVHKEPRNIDVIENSDALRHLDDLGGAFPDSLAMAWVRAPTQIGTLGGGNHFLEVQADENDCVWLMLHSGSRALGKAVCDYYNAQAVALNERYFSEVLKAWELAFIPRDDALAREYLAWMDLCLVYAAENRTRMMTAMVGALAATVGGATVEQAIDIHHNYAALEEHFGEEVFVHRKGACLASPGAMVPIPGSMETNSFIGRGLGSVESFQSCSHGAGRRMSRGAARKARTVRDMLDSLKEKGIKLGTRSQDSVLDEAGHAYKNIHDVMESQRDLVTPVHKLRPLGVVKG